jgi:hypothetical protein
LKAMEREFGLDALPAIGTPIEIDANSFCKSD